MKAPTTKQREAIRPGDIYQITHQDDRGFRGCMLVVERLETWGLTGWVQVAGGQLAFYGQVWSHIEPTGGRAVFGKDGQRVRETAVPGAHHP